MSSLEQAVTKSLECPLCIDLLKTPKLMSCGHTFCKDCLCLLQASGGNPNHIISCPLCRQKTEVKDGNVSNLKNNLQVQSLVDEMAEAIQPCTICTSADRPNAKTYCQSCKAYMCDKCLVKHNEWPSHTGHQVVTVEDIKQGRAHIKKKVLCPSHDEDEGEHYCSDVCLDCLKIMCMRCRMLDHERNGHEVLSNAEYNKKRLQEMTALSEQGKGHTDDLEIFMRNVDQKRTNTIAHIEEKRKEINKTYDEYVRKLTMRKEKLIRQLEEQKTQAEQKFKDILDDTKTQIGRIKGSSELANKSLKAPLEGGTIAMHQSLFDELKCATGKDKPDLTDASSLETRVKCIRFQSNTASNELNLGELQPVEWKKAVEKELHKKDCMNVMVATPTGSVALGSQFGGLYYYTRSGELSPTSDHNDINIRRMAYLSDGCCIIVDTSNKMLLFAVNGEKCDIKFDTLTDDEGGDCGVSVDGKDRIYVGYWKAHLIKVFMKSGGKAVREIPCKDYTPSQHYPLKSNKELVMQTNGNSVSIIDESGAVKSTVTKDGNIYYAYPALCSDDSILIAWVNKKENLLSIDRYTCDLKYKETLVDGQRIDIPERKWFYLQQFKTTGDIAFCTPDKLYIFQKSIMEV
ncbi:LOW QUALITY PROTEIN: uncharacterized protein [Diadema setosum]|uniref:LOW QUALITY PROTEIN: uncharacterized protein n=1 Tax=Diadema setosum TaxID=31175 RepID=UPI003B3BC024